MKPILPLTAATLAAVAVSAAPTASASPSLHEVCTGKIWPPAEGLMADVCQTITTHPEGPCGDLPWTGWECRTLGEQQCGGALGGKGVLR